MPTFTDMEAAAPQTEENQPASQEPTPVEPQETVGDPFDELLKASEAADPFATPAANEEVAKPAETDPVPAADPSAKGDESQFQYWQSQYDKAQRELTELKEQHTSLKDIEPLANYIKENPAVLDSVESSLSSGKTPGQTVKGNQEASLKKPDRPTKPANYDAIDAYSDPTSDSYKYREGVDSYRDEMIAYQEKKNEQVVARMEKDYQQRAQQQQVETLRTQLANGYEFSNDQVDDFMKVMSDPQSLSLDNLVTLYKMRQAPSGEVTKNLQKAEQMRAQQEKLKIAPSVGSVPAETQQEAPMEDTIMDAMIAHESKTNPWT